MLKSEPALNLRISSTKAVTFCLSLFWPRWRCSNLRPQSTTNTSNCFEEQQGVTYQLMNIGPRQAPNKRAAAASSDELASVVQFKER